MGGEFFSRHLREYGGILLLSLEKNTGLRPFTVEIFIFFVIMEVDYKKLQSVTTDGYDFRYTAVFPA